MNKPVAQTFVSRRVLLVADNVRLFNRTLRFTTHCGLSANCAGTFYNLPQVFRNSRNTHDLSVRVYILLCIELKRNKEWLRTIVHRMRLGTPLFKKKPEQVHNLCLSCPGYKLVPRHQVSPVINRPLVDSYEPARSKYLQQR